MNGTTFNIDGDFSLRGPTKSKSKRFDDFAGSAKKCNDVWTFVGNLAKIPASLLIIWSVGGWDHVLRIAKAFAPDASSPSAYSTQQEKTETVPRPVSISETQPTERVFPDEEKIPNNLGGERFNISFHATARSFDGGSDSIKVVQKFPEKPFDCKPGERYGFTLAEDATKAEAMAMVAFVREHHDRIKAINFLNNKRIDDEVLREVAKIPDLLVLGVDGNDRVTDNGLREVAKLKQINQFTAHGLTGVTESGLDAVVEGCRDLTVLGQSGSSHVSPSWIRRLKARKEGFLAFWAADRRIF